MQHDVQELNRVLCDNLEEKMKVRLTYMHLSPISAITSKLCSNKDDYICVIVKAAMLSLHSAQYADLML